MQHEDKRQSARIKQRREVTCFLAFVLALFAVVPAVSTFALPALAQSAVRSADVSADVAGSSSSSSGDSALPDALVSSSSADAIASSSVSTATASSAEAADDEATGFYGSGGSFDEPAFDARNPRSNFFGYGDEGDSFFPQYDSIRDVTVDPVSEQPADELGRIADADVSVGTSRQLDVPIICQLDTENDGRYLSAGCEVTSLAMILQANGIAVTKEQLADAVAKEPFIDDDGYYGNPNLGFVGDMEGWDEGYSVYHGPIVDLAEQYAVGDNLVVADLTGQDFEQVLKEVASGTPVWVLTDTSYAPSYNTDVWETAEGDIVVNWTVHSVVVTGYDDEYVYLNDPYLYEPNEAVLRSDFAASWKQMGSQAVVVHASEGE